ncbi:MAG: FHIPEP family type III secretion protein, partial [Simkaniaceae bacterium]|nr:FHIPEP family type III secretion protein [Simkaniaceae bacterium]
MSKVKGIANRLSGPGMMRLITGSSDIVLALFVIVIIMMIIIPIPPPVIDALIGLNLTVSIALLMVALYIQKAVNLSVFPSILLLTTIFRLAIEISATRQILLHADAGEI